MKKTLLYLSAMMMAIAAQAQITLEKKYPDWFGYMQASEIEGEGSKYLYVDNTTQNIQVFNPDHSLFKTIPTPAGWSVSFIYVANKYLFNSDAKVEVAATYYSGSTYTTKVISEDGTELLSVTNGNGQIIKRMDGAWKLLVHCAPPSPAVAYTEVYSLPGTFSGATLGLKQTAADMNTTIYPNPVENNAIISYTLPEGVHTGKVEVVNMAGQVVKSYTVTDNFKTLIINRETLAPGNYVYRVSGAGVQSAGEQFEVR